MYMLYTYFRKLTKYPLFQVYGSSSWDVNFSATKTEIVLRQSHFYLYQQHVFSQTTLVCVD